MSSVGIFLSRLASTIVRVRFVAFAVARRGPRRSERSGRTRVRSFSNCEKSVSCDGEGNEGLDYIHLVWSCR